MSKALKELAGRLPDIDTLREWSLSLAVLDAIVSADWEYRYFSFDPKWGRATALASMRTGSGDEYSIVFSKAGAFVRGFDHESPLSPWGMDSPAVAPGLVEGVPASLRQYVDEPAFAEDGVPSITVCLWREPGDSEWRFGVAENDSDGGAGWLFEQLDGSAKTYAAFAKVNFEVKLYKADVQAVLDHHPLTPELLARLNPECDADAVIEEARSMGYPLG